jgi:hypothetical protein
MISLFYGQVSRPVILVIDMKEKSGVHFYTIETKCGNEVFYVSRRFSDVLKLHETLEANAIVQSLPTPPPKWGFQMMQDKVGFHYNRKTLLEVYLATLCAIEVIWSTPCMQVFLGVADNVKCETSEETTSSIATLEEHLWLAVKTGEENKQHIDDMKRLSAVRDARLMLWMLPLFCNAAYSFILLLSATKTCHFLLHFWRGRMYSSRSAIGLVAGWCGLGVSAHLFRKWFHSLPRDDLFRRSVAVAHLTTLFLGSFKLGRLYASNLSPQDSSLFWSFLNQRLGIAMYTEMARLGGMWVKSGFECLT